MAEDHLLREPVQKRSRQTIRKIVEAARELFTELGFEETTTHLIADRAGLSVGGLYAHFKNKEGIFLYILEQRSREAHKITLDCIADIRRKKIALNEALELLFRTWYKSHTKHGKLNKEMQKFCIMNQAAGRIHDQWEKAEADEVLSLFSEYGEELKVEDPKIAVIVIARATHEVFQYLYHEKDNIEEQSVLANLIRMVQNYLTK